MALSADRERQSQLWDSPPVTVPNSAWPERVRSLIMELDQEVTRLSHLRDTFVDQLDMSGGSARREEKKPRKRR
jgi:hypothetical protein